MGYLTAGFPTLGSFKDSLRQVALACDVVEIGVPFSDPMADGTTVQRASFVALQNGVTLPWILEELKSAPRQRAPILLMSYLNPLLAYGLDRLPRDAAATGVAGFIVPDLPFEESGELNSALETQGLALVQMVTPVTPPERRDVMPRGQGLCLRRDDGTTGKSAECRMMCRVLDSASTPFERAGGAGFGIRSKAQVARFVARGRRGGRIGIGRSAEKGEMWGLLTCCVSRLPGASG